MKHKTADLEGALLDAAVAKAEGMPARVVASIAEWNGGFSPSATWQHGGAIIERERIELLFDGKQWFAGQHVERWRVDDHIEPGATTPLIAAMRAYVASKFGDEVEL